MREVGFIVGHAIAYGFAAVMVVAAVAGAMLFWGELRRDRWQDEQRRGRYDERRVRANLRPTGGVQASPQRRPECPPVMIGERSA